MNRSIYSTNSSFYNQDNRQPEDRQQPGVIRPPIRNAYETQQDFERAVQIGINYSRQHNIQYIDHY